MEKKVIVVCAVVGFLGILSAVLAFSAEGTRIKTSDVTLNGNQLCVYPEKRSAAAGLGTSSALILLVAQIAISSFNGCFCCRKKQSSFGGKQTISFITFIASWVTFLIAFIILLGGAAINNQYGGENNYWDKCYVIKAGVFAGAGVLVIVTVALGIASYVYLSLMKQTGSIGVPPTQGISMGQPQFPAPTNPPGSSWAPQQNYGGGYASNDQPPVFVHEDTYRRQQQYK